MPTFETTTTIILVIIYLTGLILALSLYKKMNGKDTISNPISTPDIDPEILIELTANCHKELYRRLGEWAAVTGTLLDEAKRITMKYKDTDWDEKDFWLTMEEESDRILADYQRPEEDSEENESVWMRLGGTIKADKETMDKILSGDGEALTNAIRENGFLPDGESYIPSANLDKELTEGKELPEEITFDISPGELELEQI